MVEAVSLGEGEGVGVGGVGEMGSAMSISSVQLVGRGLSVGIAPLGGP